MQTITMLVMWILWKERNSRILNGTSSSVEQTFNAAIREEANTWMRAGNVGLELARHAGIQAKKGIQANQGWHGITAQ